MGTQTKFFTEYGHKDLGNTEIDGSLVVSGNLTVNGTQTIIDSTTTSVTDSMLELASGNTTADLIDIGFYGNYNDGLSGESGVSEYTGLFRDASDSTWKLFDGLETEPSTTVDLSGGNYALADLQLGDLTSSTLTAAGLSYPSSDGSNGQAIITDGSGGLSFGTVSASTDGIITSGVTTIIQSQDDTNVIHVNNSAEVGIGTASPAAKLDVQGGTGSGTHTHAVFTGTTGRGLALKSGQTGGQHNGKAILDAQDTEAGGASMDFQIGGTSKLIIDNSGNVGIGTQAPSTTLHVTSPAASNKSAIITRSSGAEAVNLSEMQDYNALQILNKSSGSYLNFAGSASHTSIQAQSNGSTAEDIALNPYGGNVFIGQTSQTGYTFAQKLVVGEGDANDGITIQSGGTHQGNLAFNHSDGTTAHGRISYQHSTNYMQFFVNNSEKMRILTSGGITFNGDTAAANALDDYEEGTFTPSYTVDGGGSAGTVTSTNVGTYTKIGNIVHCAVRSFYVPTSGTIPTAYNITLPFQAKNNGGLAGSGSGREIAQNGKSLFIEIDGNQTAGKIKCKDGSAPPANAYIDLSFTYQAG
jgi:hypothetical protein